VYGDVAMQKFNVTSMKEIASHIYALASNKPPCYAGFGNCIILVAASHWDFVQVPIQLGLLLSDIDLNIG